MADTTEKETGDFIVAPPGDTGGGDGGGGGGGSSSSGSSSSSSSSDAGGGAAANFQAQQEARFASAFFELWGEAPHPTYISHAVNQGLTIWEFLYNEMAKPAWWRTPVAKERAEGFVNIIQQMTGGFKPSRATKKDKRNG